MTRPQRDNISFSYKSKKTPDRLRKLVDKWGEEGVSFSDKLRQSLLKIDDQEKSNQIQSYLNYHKIIKDFLSPHYPDPDELLEKTDLVLGQIFQPKASVLSGFMGNPKMFVAQVEKYQEELLMNQFREQNKEAEEASKLTGVTIQPVEQAVSEPKLEEVKPVVKPTVKPVVETEVEPASEIEAAVEIIDDETVETKKDTPFSNAELSALLNDTSNDDEEKDEGTDSETAVKTKVDEPEESEKTVEVETPPKRRNRRRPAPSAELDINIDSIGDIMKTLGGDQ